MEYYLIFGHTVGKWDQEGQFIFKDGRWERDHHEIFDRINGFDPSEPLGSPYRFGNLDIMNEMEEISEEEAFSRISEQTVEFLINKWKTELIEKRALQNKAPECLARLAGISFTLYGRKWSIGPSELGMDSTDSFDQGIIESIQNEMKEDLLRYGAENVIDYWVLDSNEDRQISDRRMNAYEARGGVTGKSGPEQKDR